MKILIFVLALTLTACASTDENKQSAEQENLYCSALDKMFYSIEKKIDSTDGDKAALTEWHESIVAAEKVAIDKHKDLLSRYATHAQLLTAASGGPDKTLNATSGAFQFQLDNSGISEYANNCGVSFRYSDIFDKPNSNKSSAEPKTSKPVISGISNDPRLNTCDQIDVEALAPILETEVYVSYINEDNYPGSPYTECKIYDDTTDAVLLYINIDADKDTTIDGTSSTFFGSEEYTPVEITGSKVGWQYGDLGIVGKYSSLKVVENETEYYITGRTPKGKPETTDPLDYSYIKKADLLTLLQQISSDLASQTPVLGELISSCEDISIDTFSSSVLEQFQLYEFDKTATCTAKLESDEFFSVSLNTWDKAPAYLQDVVEFRDGLPGELTPVTSSTFDKAYYRGDKVTNFFSTQSLLADEFYAVSGSDWIQVTVLRDQETTPHPAEELEQAASQIYANL